MNQIEILLKQISETQKELQMLIEDLKRHMKTKEKKESPEEQDDPDTDNLTSLDSLLSSFMEDADR